MARHQTEETNNNLQYHLLMPRRKTRSIARAICVLFVLCSLYYIRVQRWPSNSALNYQRKPSSSLGILDQVNMFIGTKNGGKRKTHAR